MSLIEKIKPEFWDDSIPAEDSGIRLFDYAKVWKVAVLGTSAMVLLPLIIMFFLDHYQYKKDFEGELLKPFSSFASHTQQSIASFISQRQMTLLFIAEDNPFKALTDERRLVRLFSNLKKAFGGFEDLSIIDSRGMERAYAGPDRRPGEGFEDQPWFKEAREKGTYVGEMKRNLDHSNGFMIVVRHKKDNEDAFLLKAYVNALPLEQLIEALKGARPAFDAFMVNREGLLQTSSLFYGKAFERLFLSPESLPNEGEIRVLQDKSGRAIVLSSMAVEGTPFRFMAVAPREALTGGLFSRSKRFAVILVVCLLSVLIAVLGFVTHLVSRVYKADRRRVSFLHKLQYTNKMASVGRLAAGVAHEINNPLAIINEKAGLLKDLITLKKERSQERVLEIAESILLSVERCGAITHRLLGFARHSEVRFETIHLDQFIRDILLFFGKESEFRGISIHLSAPEDLRPIESDMGRLEQVFLNIIHNAFEALEDGGRIEIALFIEEPNRVGVSITDDGCGISGENLNHIFDPFFSTKGEKGSGLGLSITYGIVQQLGGKLSVKSREGEGTCFTVMLPVRRDAWEALSGE